MAELRRNHVVWISGLSWDLENLEATAEQFLSFCKTFGEPIPHNHSPDSLVWDIKFNADSDSKIITHSERSAEAELHTDSAFSSQPEDMFCLLVVKKAECGGGESLLLTTERLLEAMRKHPDCERHEQVLRNKDFPFLIPTIFRKDLTAELEYNVGPILDGEEIRYRSDMIQRCIEVAPHLFDAEMIEALNFLKGVVDNCESTSKVTLQTGDLLILNNKSLLHGRTAFEDESRHLMRVRLRRHA